MPLLGFFFVMFILPVIDPMRGGFEEKQFAMAGYFHMGEEEGVAG